MDIIPYLAAIPNINPSKSKAIPAEKEQNRVSNQLNKNHQKAEKAMPRENKQLLYSLNSIR
jgi:hypothetical protein